MNFGGSTSAKPALRHVTNRYRVRQEGRTTFLRTTTPRKSASRRSARPAIPSLLRTDQTERRILRKPFGVVDILIAGDATVDGPAEQIGERKSGVLPTPHITNSGNEL